MACLGTKSCTNVSPEFAEERLIVKPTARMHISEFNKAFRAQYGRYRTQDAMSDVKIEGLFKSYARKVGLGLELV